MNSEATLIQRTTRNFKNNHKTTELTCQNCEQTFLANRRTAKFCSSSCRSQFWLRQHNKKVITLAVPEEVDDEYLDYIKSLLINYKPSATSGEEVEETFIDSAKIKKTFDDRRELNGFLASHGYINCRLPERNLGIYCDGPLTIKKIDKSWEVSILKRS